MKLWSHQKPPLVPPPTVGAGHIGGDGPSWQEQLHAAARVVRDELGSKRSDKLLRLFDFLMRRTLEQRQPTELEIAGEVFATGEAPESLKDATVRVYIYRLRKMMDEIYRDQAGPRLMVPVGEYSICLIGAPEPVAPELPATTEPAGEPTASPPLRCMMGKMVILAVAGLAFVVTGLIFFLSGLGPLGGAPAPPLWRAIEASDRPITIVMGDYFLFGQTGSTEPVPGAPPRLVWDRSVIAREDLDIYLMRNPAESARIRGPKEQYVSSGTLLALEKVQTVLRNTDGGRTRPFRLIAASQLPPDIFKGSDVVYVGLLSGLSVLLRDPLFQSSGFRLDDRFNKLTDTATGTQYQSDGLVLTGERIPRMDYGYIASLPGPAGSTIMVIAGIRDPGLLEMAELANDPVRLAATGLGSDQPLRSFEALYRVRTMAAANLGATLVLRRDLQIQGIWDKSKALTGPGAVSAPPEWSVSPTD